MFGIPKWPARDAHDRMFGASNNTGDAGPTPAFTPYARLLPKDLLVHARKLDKEEADRAVLEAVKKNKVNTSPTPVFNPIIGGTTSSWPVYSAVTTSWANTSTINYTISSGS